MPELRVLDLSQDIAGSYCGRLFAAMGSAVTKVELPAGDPLRNSRPFVGGHESRETSSLFLHLNAGKCSVTLDYESERGRDLLLRLVESSDLVIESFAPGRMADLGLSYERLRDVNPEVVLTSISAFGQTGPYRDFKATEMGLRAMSGEMYLAGQPRQPLKKGGNVAQYLAGLNGFIGSMGAIFRREQAGGGSHVDISAVESMMSILGQAFREQSLWGFIPGRRPGGLGWPNNIYPCRDGYMMTFTAYASGDAWWPPFVEMIRDGEPIEVPSSPPRDEESLKEWDDRFREWLSKRDRREVHKEGQKRGLAFGYLATAPDLFDSPQLGHRKFLSEIEHPVAGVIKEWSLPFLINGERPPARRSPLLGEHNSDVYGGCLGVDSEELTELERSGVV